MVKRYEHALFDGFRDRDSGRLYADTEFHNCHFQSGFISNARDPKKRSVVRNIYIRDCEVTGCTIDSAVFQDVVVENLKTNQLLQIWGAVFSHVVIRGRIGRMMISHNILGMQATKGQQKKFDVANEQFYRNVDWAVDISDGLFMECEIHGIPARLIRRNPEHQFLVKKANLLDGRWKNFGLRGTAWELALSDIASEPFPDGILVVPLGDQEWRKDIQRLNRLRDAGILE